MSRRRSAKHGSYASFSLGASEPTPREKAEIRDRAIIIAFDNIVAHIEHGRPSHAPSEGTPHCASFGSVRRGRLGITIG